MKIQHTLSLLALSVTLAACGGSDSSSTVEEPSVTLHGPFATGTSSASYYAYFDLDTGTQLTLTEEEAATNSEWDIAFKRTGVYLNQHADNTVTTYFTGNNADFYDAEGAVVADMFLNATPETELEDYNAVTYASIPADESEFVGDVTEAILDGWYNYDGATHAVTAAADNYYVVSSDETYTKFRVSSLVQAGFAMSEVTLSYANQGASDVEFGAEQDLTLDLAMLCASDDTVYVDFDAGMEVTSADDYDLTIPCATGGAEFDMDLADDAKAFQDFENSYTAIDTAYVRYLGLQSNEYSVKAFDQNKWYAYSLEGNHKLWSQYGVFIVKNANGYFKLQITSYYDAEGTSGSYSFRADELVAE